MQISYETCQTKLTKDNKKHKMTNVAIKRKRGFAYLKRRFNTLTALKVSNIYMELIKQTKFKIELMEKYRTV